jgi:hypothetical protein
MSAYFSVCYEDRIELLTDGAFYNDQGILLDVREKVYRSSLWPLALTGRGAAPIAELGVYLDMTGSLVSSVDGLIEKLQTFLDNRRLKGSPAPFEILIAAFVSSGPTNLYFSTEPLMDGVEPWIIHDVGPEIGGGPNLTLDDAAECGISIESLNAGLEEYGADLMEIMRRQKSGNPTKPFLPDVYGIGGHVDLTVIRPTGSSTKRIHTWPDVIGEPINPFAADEQPRIVA